MCWVLLERYDSIQLSAEPEIPTSNWRRSKRTRWSTVSNAALKSRSTNKVAPSDLVHLVKQCTDFCR